MSLQATPGQDVRSRTMKFGGCGGCGEAAIRGRRRGCARSLPDKRPGSAFMPKPGRAVPHAIAELARRSLEPEEPPV